MEIIQEYEKIIEEVKNKLIPIVLYKDCFCITPFNYHYYLNIIKDLTYTDVYGCSQSFFPIVFCKNINRFISLPSDLFIDSDGNYHKHRDMLNLICDYEKMIKLEETELNRIKEYIRKELERKLNQQITEIEKVEEICFSQTLTRATQIVFTTPIFKGVCSVQLDIENRTYKLPDFFNNQYNFDFDLFSNYFKLYYKSDDRQKSFNQTHKDLRKQLSTFEKVYYNDTINFDKLLQHHKLFLDKNLYEYFNIKLDSLIKISYKDFIRDTNEILNE